MGCDCCSPSAPAPGPDFDSVPIKEETSSCQDACCDSDDPASLDTTAPGQRGPTLEKPDDGCPPGEFTDNKTENDTNAPDCCRGKVNPCCDTSCLDRLALRECELAVELPAPRHAASMVSLSSTAMALFYKPWDVSAVRSSPLARKAAVKSASAVP
ncbi:hypothetical protein MW887_000465 [Aspergillus wentii]|nr:hypothetical protein MW887_000465 [Aspergillus wentii]